MRILAILSNLFLLGVVIFFFAAYGAPDEDAWVLWVFVIPMILAPIFSLITIIANKRNGWLSGNNWLLLYLKRKTIEEKQKIDRLTGNNN